MQPGPAPPLEPVRPIRWDAGHVIAVDQTRLPADYVELELADVESLARAIERLAIRGAPLLGIAAAYGVALAAQPSASTPVLDAAIARLRATRPTARDLFAALERMDRLRREWQGHTGTEPPPEAILAEAQAIHAEDLERSARIAAYAPAVFTTPGWVLTICNTGALATGGGGTALGVIAEGWRLGLVAGVFVCETRPLLQGARLTAWELDRLGIPFTLLCDSAAASLIASGRVGWVITGADRIARNGDFANKVGTLMLAQAAQAQGIPFYVAAPVTTFDPASPTGAAIAVEQRAAEEVTCIAGVPIAPVQCSVYNPAFDVTPAHFVTGFITDRGVVTPQDLEGGWRWNLS